MSFFAGLLLLAGYAAAASAMEASTEEAAIRANNQAWVKGYNAGNPKAVAGLYAETAVLLPPGNPAANGNAAIQAFLAKDMAESAKAGVTLSIGAKPAVGRSGDLAWESGPLPRRTNRAQRSTPASTLLSTKREAGSGSSSATRGIRMPHRRQPRRR